MLTRGRDIGGVFMLGQGQDTFHQEGAIGALEDIGYEDPIEFEEDGEIAGFGKKLKKKLKKGVKKYSSAVKKAGKKVGKFTKKYGPTALQAAGAYFTGGASLAAGGFGGMFGKAGKGATPGILPDEFGGLPGQDYDSYGYGSGPTPMSAGAGVLPFRQGEGEGGGLNDGGGILSNPLVLGIGAVAAVLLLRRK